MTTAHTRLDTRGFSRASLHFGYVRASGDEKTRLASSLSTMLLSLVPEINITSPQTSNLVNHQSNQWRYYDSTTSSTTSTNQSTLTVKEEREYLKTDTFAKSMQLAKKQKRLHPDNCLPLLLLQL